VERSETVNQFLNRTSLALAL